MIVTRTPTRISFVGGGTDMPSFYKRHDGQVISVAIDKYITILLTPKFDGRFRVSYSRTENVDEWKDIQHDIVREVMKVFDFKGMEVVSVSDIPGEGTGLGSSSAFTVGLMRAAYAHVGIQRTAKLLADDAFKLEAKACGHPVGKQDHYIAAYGGLCHLKFTKNEVKLSTFGLFDEQYAEIYEKLMLFWTGVSRKADDILQVQAQAFEKTQKAYENGLMMTELVAELKDEFDQGDFSHLGRCVGVGWQLKKGFAGAITDTWIDTVIASALKAGADGAKICGAGGGGFLLVVAPKARHAEIEKAVGFRRVPFRLAARGSQVVFQED